MNELAEKIFKALENMNEIEACALGGSRAAGRADGNSDYDVYLYLTGDIPEEVRREAFSEMCSVMEIGNRFWEYEDNLILTDGTPMDIIYRSLDDFSEGISRVCDEFAPGNGYTTCMWHNLLNSRIVFDRSGRYTALQKKYDIPYPEKLADNIISRNMQLLADSLPCYPDQIKKAALRSDINSVNHRTAEFMASYFDVIFALNKKTHPGEKKLVSICLAECGILPADFENNISELFKSIGTAPEKTSKIAAVMADELKKTVNARAMQ
ncbi:MAG: DUF4037 domain-containing protein [Oscillospiraceae bacterium]|nr:DUF4037 domain-containing protein [Oscillospiraceae bacterium]